MSGNTVTVIAAVVAAVGTLATAAATSISAYQIAEIQRQTSDRQSDIEMVKLALNILGGEISDKTKESRRFAVSLLSKYSGVEIEPTVRLNWAEAGSVSFAREILGLSNDIGAMNRAVVDDQIEDILTTIMRKNKNETRKPEPQMRQNTYPNPADPKD
ncbi:hypothetical protein [Brucella intermedia]|uniref:hypothetical protein n=1 Tax=Brucella intermedia TaxID=94625 RepID=UPI00124D5FF4|nr:hypothetical protein [Brucella intermedia]KAB2716649.1 hypothetical protein F9K75_11170 [Brucella intermedia]